MARFLGNLVVALFGVAVVSALYPRSLTRPTRRAGEALLDAWLALAYWIASRRPRRRP
jgi:hypothetical protein